MNMAHVALGGTNANFEYGIHAWDIAAGALIVTEAGGVVIDPAGKIYFEFCKFSLQLLSQNKKLFASSSRPR